MITKEYLEQINPNVESYNPKYSWGTYIFLKRHNNRDIKVYWKKYSGFDGEEVKFNKDNLLLHHVYFCFKSDGDLLGTTWQRICWNKYVLMDYSNYEDIFEDITDWFFEEYLRIGRCLIDTEHNNFLINKDHSYVQDEDRFEYVGDREWIENTLKRSSVPLNGYIDTGDNNVIKSAIIDDFPEMLNKNNVNE